MDLFENAVFLFSCGRVKTELFENADVTASIYDVSEHALGSLGDHARAFCLSVFFYGSSNAEYRYLLWNFVVEYRIVSVTAFSCGRGYFRKRSSCGRESF